MKITYDMCVHRLIEPASHQIMSKNVQGRKNKKKSCASFDTNSRDHTHYIASQRTVKHDQTSILLLSFAKNYVPLCS